MNDLTPFDETALSRLICHYPICFNKTTELEHKRTRLGYFRGYFHLSESNGNYFGLCISEVAPSVTMPNKFDWAVLLTIMNECFNNKTDEVNLGSLYSITKLIGSPNGGDYSQKIFDSLVKWSFIDLSITRKDCENIAIHRIVTGLDYKEKGERILNVALNKKWLALTENGGFMKVSPKTINTLKSDFTANLYIALKNKLELNKKGSGVIKWSIESLLKHTGAKSGQRSARIIDNVKKSLQDIKDKTNFPIVFKTYKNKQGILIFEFKIESLEIKN